MEHFRLNKLSESDIDAVISAAGGHRAVRDCSIEHDLNADYLLDDAVVELKLFNEEGLEKQTRREKLAAIFKANQPECPVVVLDPLLLDEVDRRKYYNALEGPIKTQVKKAAKQLESTAKQQPQRCLRVLFAVNNGYTALTHEEFMERVEKCARNDTSRIDVVVAAGCYYYSDTFDYNFLANCECIPIKKGVEFHAFEKIREEWNERISSKLTATIRGEETVNDPKSPVLDLVYEIEGIKYVKPSPPIGGSSSFFTNGRPRHNSAGLDECPKVAVAFPKLTQEQWRQFSNEISDRRMLETDYSTWLKFASQQENRYSNPKQPLVPVSISCEPFLTWCQERGISNNFNSMCQYAAKVFDEEVREIMRTARPVAKEGIVYPRYIFLRIEEIGQDKSLDLCSIYLRSEMPGLEYEEPIAENLNIFLEYGQALAAAYAIKQDLSAVQYEIDETYCWY